MCRFFQYYVNENIPDCVYVASYLQTDFFLFKDVICLCLNMVCMI
jgi:hypothetical protein